MEQAMRRAALLFLPIVLLVAACSRSVGWHATDITGAMPRLAFAMTRANDDKAVTAGDYRGKIALLYFGYTHCPDICPTTLANLSDMLQQLGTRANDVRVLFVTVDPDRDTQPVLRDYVKAFAPQIDGLRGSNDALVALARRYRVAYGVTPASGKNPYTVTHSDAVFFFDRDGRARLVATSTDDTHGISSDVRRLLDGS
jgi:protein SCO1/2